MATLANWLADFARRWKKGDVLLARNGLENYMVFDGHTWKPQPFVAVPSPLHFKGQVPAQPNLPTTGQNIGDVWIDNATSHMWLWTSSGWADMGQVSGATIPPGVGDKDRLSWNPALARWSTEPELKVGDLKDSYKTLVPADKQSLVYEGVSGLWKPKHVLPLQARKDDVLWHDGQKWLSRRLTFAMRFRGAIPSIADAGTILDPAPGDVLVAKDSQRTYVWDETLDSWTDIGAAQVVLLPEGTENGDLLVWDMPTQSYVAEHHWYGSEFNVDLPSDIQDKTFLAYDLGSDTYTGHQIEPYGAIPIDPSVPASDENVPTTLNVQTYVTSLVQKLQTEIAAVESGVSHQEGVIDLINAPPAPPIAEGDRYLLGLSPIGDWAGHPYEVAEYIGGNWVFTAPSVGDAHYIDAQGLTMIWNGTTFIPLSRQAQVSYQRDAPNNPIAGDIWLDNSNAAKMVIKFWTGTAWVTEAGTKTFTVQNDPAAVPANQVKDGDVWVQTPPPPPAAQTPPITHVRSAGAWTTTTPSIPASSRTYIQNTIPVGPSNGDLWINTAVTPPTKQWFWGAVPAGPGGTPAAVAGAWHGDSGARTFVQDADPTTASGGSSNPIEGDIWVTVTKPVTKVWHTTPAGPGGVPPQVSAWLVTQVTDRSQPLGYIAEAFNGSADNHIDFATKHGVTMTTPAALTKGIYKVQLESQHYGWSCDDGRYLKIRLYWPSGYDFRITGTCQAIRRCRQFIIREVTATWAEFHVVLEGVDAGGYYHPFAFELDVDITPQAGAGNSLYWGLDHENGDCNSFGGYYGKIWARLTRLANLP